MLSEAVFSSRRGDWETPRNLFDLCDKIWHFELDAASSNENALCVCNFTIEDDGLAHTWAGRRVWVNPPYGRNIAEWVEKAYNESRCGAIVVMLLPVRTDTAWWQDFVTQADEIAYIRGRLKFTLDGREQGAAPFPSALVRFGGALPTEL